MAKSFTSPLTIYILWHPEYADGARIAEGLFGVFSRNAGDPFARTPGIPVYFRSVPVNEKSQAPREIPFDESHHTAIVVLVNDHMVVDEDWGAYVSGLDKVASASKGSARIYPVAVNTNAFSFPIANTNFIRLFEVKEKKAPEGARPVEKAQPIPSQVGSGDRGEGVTVNIFIDSENTESIRVERKVGAQADTEVGEVVEAAEPPAVVVDETVADPVSESDLLERRLRFLTGKLVHELSRLLYQRPRVTDQGTVQSSPPVRLFISHAKADGALIAEEIRNYIHADTSMKSFFDANDIAVGYRFSDELLAALEQSAIICLQTDYYATREWCLWEVINAKRLDRPVVVVNAVTDREPRSFPYLGNVPTIRWQFESADGKEQIQNVLDATLFEVLGTRYCELFHKELIGTFNLPKSTGVVGHPPELFTILKMAPDGTPDGSSRENPHYVVYPDPPLGDEELQLLEDLAPAIRFITPTMVPLVQHELSANAE